MTGYAFLGVLPYKVYACINGEKLPIEAILYLWISPLCWSIRVGCGCNELMKHKVAC